MFSLIDNALIKDNYNKRDNLIDSWEKKQEFNINYYPMTIDTDKGIISVKGKLTVGGLYDKLSGIFSNPQMMDHSIPCIACTNESIVMTNGFNISEESMPFLSGGSIIQNKDRWESMVEV